MKAKSKTYIGFIVGLFALLGIFFAINYNAQTSISARAATTTPKYLALGTVNRVADLPSNLDYNYTEEYTKADYYDYFTVHIYGNSYSSETTAANDAYFTFSYVTIVANVKVSKHPDSNFVVYNHVSYSLVNNTTGTTVSGQSLSGTGEKTLVSKTLADGYYTLYYSVGGVASLNLGSAYDNFSYSFYIDTTAPKITGASVSQTGKYVNTGFTVSVSDNVSGVAYFYMKEPSAMGYSMVVGKLKTIPVGNENGLYRFYARDKAGNTTATYYVYYDSVLPTGILTTADGETLSNAYTNQAFSYAATDTGSDISKLQYKTPSSSTWISYTSGTTIATTDANGIYQFRAIDKAGNISAEKSVCLDVISPTGTLYADDTAVESGMATNLSLIKFMAEDGCSGIKDIYVKEPTGTDYKAYTNGYAYTKNGEYSFYCVDNSLNVSQTYTIKLDNVPPVLVCQQTSFYTSYDCDFTVTARDANSDFKFFYKTPEMTIYQTMDNSSYTVKETWTDGKYYFYAEDTLGNVTSLMWIELKVAYPEAHIFKDDDLNTYKITWSDDSTGGGGC